MAECSYSLHSPSLPAAVGHKDKLHIVFTKPFRDQLNMVEGSDSHVPIGYKNRKVRVELPKHLQYTHVEATNRQLPLSALHRLSVPGPNNTRRSG